MMRSAIRLRPIVLVLLAIFCLAGCAGKGQSPLEKMAEAFADLRAEVQVVVADPERAAQANILIDQLQQTYTDNADSVESRKDRLRELNEDYDSSRTAMDEQLELIIADLGANQQVVLAIAKQMSALLTPEEKDELAKARSKALNAAIKAMDAI